MSKTKRDIPVFAHPIIETHCHLDYLEAEQLATTLAEASAVNIEKIVTISVSPANLASVRQLTEHANVWGTQGIHPHEAEHANADTFAELEQYANAEKIVAIGEIGLDYHYEHADHRMQHAVFERQLALAVERERPIVVHTREADDDCRAILSNFSRQLTKKGVIHSFTSGLPLAEWCLAEGFMLGFNGIITFNRADNVREVVCATPLQQLVIETDAPYLTPVPYRGKPNAPKYLPFIVEKIAQLKGATTEQVLKHTYDNAHRLFWPEQAAESGL